MNWSIQVQWSEAFAISHEHLTVEAQNFQQAIKKANKALNLKGILARNLTSFGCYLEEQEPKPPCE